MPVKTVQTPPAKAERLLQDHVIKLAGDPLNFVRFIYPWGEPGDLADHSGPDEWQSKFLARLGQEVCKPGTDNIRFATSSGNGIGKALFYKEKVFTVDGETAMGALQEGDEIIGSDGRPCRVLGVYPQGRRPLYRVTFSDGASVLADANHLWTVTTRDDRANGRPPRTLTTEVLRTTLFRHYQIPMAAPVAFAERPHLIHPYLLGYLLGNGSLCTPGAVKISCHDLEIYAHIQHLLPTGYTLAGSAETYKHISQSQFHGGKNAIWQELTRLGLTGVKSPDRFIPSEYLYDSIRNRTELLRGLMDSDGCCVNVGTPDRPNHHRVMFSTSSLRLRDDFIALVQSLGGTCGYNTDTRRNHIAILHDHGVYRGISRYDNYQLSPNLPKGINPFFLKRKADAYANYDNTVRRGPIRVIRSIELEKEDDAICIRVDNPNQQFLTSHFVVTHNSTLVAWIIHWFISTRPHPQIRVTANTREQLLKTTFRELAVWHKRALNAHWFTWTATKFYHNEHPETWFANAIPWSAENPEAFAGLHAPHTMVLFDEACHDDQTEVLTDHGWKYFANLTGEEQLLTMNPATGRCFYERPTKLFVAPFKGELWEYTNRGANFCVTPNHKMWEQRFSPRSDRSAHYTEWRATPISEITSQEFFIPKTIPVWDGQPHTEFTVPQYGGQRKTWDALTVPMEEWTQFLGWYYSEGSLGYQKDGHPCEVRISQKDTAILKSLRQTVNRWGCSTTIYTCTTTPQLSIRHRGLSEYLSSFGKGCLEKRLPPELREATRRQQRLFLDAFCQGDGYVKGNRRILYTSNKGLADDLHEVALKAGYNSTVTTRKLRGITTQLATHTATSSRDGYAISLAESNPRAKIRQKYIRKIPYSGTVYCAEVPTHHLLMTRRNGVAMWSGNSGIDDVIWEFTEGAMTTNKVLWLAFGNPTKNSGRFRECFGSQQHRWITTRVDSRTAKMANKGLISQWIEDYGEDSDFVRVRVKGEFPRAGSTQFIPSDLVERAMRNRVITDGQETRVLAVDVARFGDDQTIFLERHGSRVLPLTKYRGLDTMQVAALVAERIDATQPDCTFVDGTGLGAGVVDRLRSLNYRIIDVQAGGKPDDPEKYFNKRAEMWGRAREWLRGDVELPQDDGLKVALTGLEYGYSAKMAIQLEKKEDMKKRGLASPDEADALAYSFAEPVRAQRTVFIPQGLVRGAEAGGRSNKLRGSRRDLDWRVV